MRLKFRRSLTGEKEGASLLGLARLSRSPRHGWTVELNPVRCLIALLVLAVLGYVVAVAAAYTVRARRPHNQVQFMDIALPWRWKNISVQAGHTNLEHGKALFEEQNYRSALHLLRAGLRRAPGDHQARLLLAQLYYGARQSEAATDVLADGLEHGYPEDPKYVDLLLYLLALREDFDAIARVAKTLRGFPEIQADPERWQHLADLEIKTLKKRRDFEGILNYARDMQANGSSETELDDLEILALMQLGFFEEADRLMDSLPIASQYTATHTYLQAMRALLLADFDTADEAAGLVMHWPTKPYALQAQLIIEMDEAAQPERRDRLMGQYIDIHRDSFPAMVTALQSFEHFLGVEQTDALLDSMRRLDPEKARDWGLGPVFARLYTSRATQAQPLYLAWKAEIPQEHEDGDEDEDSLNEYAWLDALFEALLAQGQDDRKALWDLTRQQRFPAKAYLVSARALTAAKDWETAERVAENGLHFYPHDPELAALRQQAARQAP